MARLTLPSSLLFASLSAAGGCYRYAPVEVADLRPGMSVRMDLSAVAVDRIRSGPAAQARLLSDFTVTGRVQRLANDSLLLVVPTSVLDAQARARTEERDLGLLRTDVQRARLRTLDRARTTWTSVALGVAGVASVVLALQRGGRSTGTSGNPPPPPEIRIPLSLRWLVP